MFSGNRFNEFSKKIVEDCMLCRSGWEHAPYSILRQRDHYFLLSPLFVCANMEFPSHSISLYCDRQYSYNIATICSCIAQCTETSYQLKYFQECLGKSFFEVIWLRLLIHHHSSLINNALIYLLDLYVLTSQRHDFGCLNNIKNKMERLWNQ